MHPEDRVLVGVINTKRDLKFALEQHWYRIPLGQAPKGIMAEYLAFFLSGSAPPKGQPSGIYYFTEQRGVELATRRELVGNIKPHPRDEHVYHKIQLGATQARVPPITNPTNHRFAFIYSTWDRFQRAQHINDLYSNADYLVDRVFHILKQEGYKPRRSWEVVYPTIGAQLRIIADSGEVIAGTQLPDNPDDSFVYLNPADYLQGTEASVSRIKDVVRRFGGPKMVDLPVELY